MVFFLTHSTLDMKVVLGNILDWGTCVYVRVWQGAQKRAPRKE